VRADPRRVAVATALAAALLPALVSCGRGPSYCEAVHDHQSDLGSIVSGGDQAGLIAALPIFRDLQGRSPDDVADDWDLVVTRIEGLDDALDHAHVDPATYDPKHPPAGLDEADRTAIRRAAAQLAATDTQDALTRVQQEVLDVCHTPLEL
jgi:hypothetical protein